MEIFASPRGIDNLKPRQPVGAIVSVGEKGPRGNPVNKDRFFILSTGFADVGNNAKGMRGKKHPRDPRLRKFNDHTGEEVSTLRGVIMYRAEEESLHVSRSARQLRSGQSIPGGRPACTGNGETAITSAVGRLFP